MVHHQIAADGRRASQREERKPIVSYPQHAAEIAQLLRASEHLTAEETAQALLQRYTVREIEADVTEARTLGQADVVAAIRSIRWSEVPAVQEDLDVIHDTLEAALDPFEDAAALIDGNDY